MERNLIVEQHLENISFNNLYKDSTINIGAHGEVWKYLDKFTNESYAVKIIKQESTQLSLPTRKEIENLYSIQNAQDRPACFLQFYGYVIYEEKNMAFEELKEVKCCLIFEMANGTLADLINLRKIKKNYLSFDEFHKITRTIIEGMAFLQSKNITHRDIKPENILIKLDEIKNVQIKIADFSESKLDIPNSTVHNMTIKGTPSYLSPELFYSWMSRNPLDHNSYKSDVYSLGLTLLELGLLEKLLTGDKRRLKELENPKNQDHGPFDHDINKALENFIEIYLIRGVNDKKVKDLVAVFKSMLSYQESFRFDFLTLMAVLGTPTSEDNRVSVFSQPKKHSPSQAGLGSMVAYHELPHHEFDIRLKDESIRIIGCGSEEIKAIMEGKLKTILENIPKIGNILDFQIITKSEKGPKKFFQVCDRLFKFSSQEIKNLSIYSIPSLELLNEQKSPYCEWMYGKFYNPQNYEPFSMGLIHRHTKHWDLGINDEESMKLFEYMNMVTLDNINLESVSLVLVGEINLTNITLKSALDSIKKLYTKHLKHLKIHLEGLFFTKEFEFIKQIQLALFDRKKINQTLDYLESLHIGLSSDLSVNETGLKDIIDQQKNLKSLSLYFKHLQNDKILKEINESLTEGLFVHLKNLTIGLHFQDDYEITSVECQLKDFFRKICSYYVKKNGQKLESFSFLIHSFFNIDDSFQNLFNIIINTDISKFDIYWKNLENGLLNERKAQRKNELETIKKSDPKKYVSFYFEF